MVLGLRSKTNHSGNSHNLTQTDFYIVKATYSGDVCRVTK